MHFPAAFHILYTGLACTVKNMRARQNLPIRKLLCDFFIRACLTAIILLAVPFQGRPLPTLAAQTVAPQPAEPRKTSRPCSLDLSSLENPDREKMLQVQRVMDILDINQASTVVDI